MARFRALLTALAALALLAPSASATGWLVQVNNGGFGINPLGGRGDTVDVGVGSAGDQCTDEEDVLDVAIGTAEGNGACGGTCSGTQGTFGPPLLDALATAAYTLLLGWQPTPATGECSDTSDTVDVSVAANEGDPADPCDGAKPGPHGDDEDGVDAAFYPRESCDSEDGADVSVLGYEGFAAGSCSGEGDARDGVEASALTTEFCDADDGADAGVLNCERFDADDEVDVGVANTESGADDGDTLDLAVLSDETGDGPDGNGANVLTTTGGTC